jgi:hypothetical protein
VLQPSRKHNAGGRGSGQAANPFAITLLPQTKRAAQVELRPPRENCNRPAGGERVFVFAHKSREHSSSQLDTMTRLQASFFN